VPVPGRPEMNAGVSLNCAELSSCEGAPKGFCSWLKDPEKGTDMSVLNTPLRGIWRTATVLACLEGRKTKKPSTKKKGRRSAVSTDTS